jgi:hypothetical protein
MLNKSLLREQPSPSTHHSTPSESVILTKLDSLILINKILTLLSVLVARKPPEEKEELLPPPLPEEPQLPQHPEKLQLIWKKLN